MALVSAATDRDTPQPQPAGALRPNAVGGSAASGIDAALGYADPLLHEMTHLSAGELLLARSPRR
jgi:hypothetical protein